MKRNIGASIFLLILHIICVCLFVTDAIITDHTIVYMICAVVCAVCCGLDISNIRAIKAMD